MTVTDVMPAVRDDPERSLRAAAAAGDPAAFAALYLRCRETVLRYLLRRTNGDVHLAEDLTHETFARALARMETYREMGRPFVAWLVTIAGHLVADHYKSSWRRYQVPHGDFAGQVDDGSFRLVWHDGQQLIDEMVVEEDERRYHGAVLAEAITTRLTGWQRRVVLLRYVEGLSVRDTATKLQVNEGSVKAATFRAVRALEADPAVRALRPGGRS